LIAWAPLEAILRALSHRNRLIPLSEAASHIYGELRGTDLGRYTEGHTGAADEILDNIGMQILHNADVHVRRHPSPKWELFSKSDIRKMGVCKGATGIRYWGKDQVFYTDPKVSRKDLARITKHLKQNANFVSEWSRAALPPPERPAPVVAPQAQPALLPPKAELKCSFNMNDAGCVRRNTVFTQIIPVLSPLPGAPTQFTTQQTNCDWYRIRVDAEGGNISGCRGRILSVTRGGGELLSGENPSLPFAHGDQADGTITIYEGVQEDLDLLAIFNDRVMLAVPPRQQSSSINWADMFTYAGDYQLKVAVTSPDAPASSIELLFRWTLNRNTAEIIQRPPQRKDIANASSLQIEVGESEPFFYTAGGIWDTKRTFNVKLSNNHNSKSAEFCRLHIIKIEPQTEYNGPWTLSEIRSLAAGDHRLVPLAIYGEARNPETTNCADSFFTVLAEKRQPKLDTDRKYEFLLRATAHDMPLSELHCKLWVDEKGRFRIEQS
jgi:hypothetical protein